jgi:hypothetical protein
MRITALCVTTGCLVAVRVAVVRIGRTHTFARSQNGGRKASQSETSLTADGNGAEASADTSRAMRMG